MKYHYLSGRRVCRSEITLLSACLLCLSVFCMHTVAQDGAVGRTIDLDRALRQTLQDNADLKAWPYQLRISDGDVVQASMRPLPTAGLTVENVLGNGLYSGSDAAEITLTLGQLIEFGGKRDSRVSYATATMNRKQAEYGMARLDVLAETSRRYYEVLRVQALQRWIDRRIASEGEALAIVRNRAKAGATGQADVARMQLRLSRSRALAAQLDGRAELARLQLAAMWSTTPDFVYIQGDMLALPAIPPPSSLRAAVDAAPAMQLEQTQLRLAEAQVRLAQAQGKVDLEVGVGLRHIELSNDQALVFDLSVPIPLRNPNRGRIDAARASRDLSSEQAELRRTGLYLSLLAQQQALLNQHRQAQLIGDQLLPEARQLLADTEQAYLTGRYSVLQWVDAQTELFALERDLIEIHALVYLQLLELERITGRPLSSLQTENGIGADYE